METIKTAAQMKQLWHAPVIVFKKFTKESVIRYQSITDNISAYEKHCLDGTLDLAKQKTLLMAISDDCTPLGPRGFLESWR